jgi:hypothetical protein
VKVAATGGQIIVRLNDAVVSEQRQATGAGQCIVKREHLAELRKITKQQTAVPEAARWHVDFQTRVDTLPLTRFEEVLT